jgi:Ca2+-binding EF-hand superfamily protein
MSDKNRKLTELEIRDLFQKYDVNKDNTINREELFFLVRDIYIRNHDIKDIKDLTSNEEILINRSVDQLLKERDVNKDGSLQVEEFLSYHQGNDIIQSTSIIHFKIITNEKKNL